MAEGPLNIRGRVSAAGSHTTVNASPERLRYWQKQSELDRHTAEEIVERHTMTAVKKSMDLVEDELKADIRARSYRTGAFERSIHQEIIKVGNHIVGDVFSRLARADWLEHGTGVYGPKHTPITPLAHKYLKYRNKGGTYSTTSKTGRTRVRRSKNIFIKSVRGTPARHHFALAARMTRPAVSHFHQEAAHRAAEEMKVRNV